MMGEESLHVFMTHTIQKQFCSYFSSASTSDRRTPLRSLMLDVVLGKRITSEHHHNVQALTSQF